MCFLFKWVWFRSNWYALSIIKLNIFRVQFCTHFNNFLRLKISFWIIKFVQIGKIKSKEAENHLCSFVAHHYEMDALCWNHPAISLKPTQSSENHAFLTPKSSSLLFHCRAVMNSSNPESKPSPLKIQNRMFILGMGFVGQFFAQELKYSGW